MLILGKDQLKDPTLGYARTFVRQVEDCLGARAGEGRADRRQRRRPQPGRAGREAARGRRRAGPRAEDRLGRRRQPGPARGRARLRRARSPPTPTSARSASPRALEAGADIVVTGRVTDASVVVGPAIWQFGWSPEQYDELAGAVVAGHVIECGTQATGGNFSGFLDLPARRAPARLPDRRDRGRRQLRHHQARRHRRPGLGRHGHRAADVRDAVDPLPRPRRHRRPLHDRARLPTAPTGCASPASAAWRRRTSSRSASTSSAASATRWSSCSPASTSRRRPTGCAPSSTAASRPRRCPGRWAGSRSPTPRARRVPRCCCAAWSRTTTRPRSASRSLPRRSSSRSRRTPASR